MNKIHYLKNINREVITNTVSYISKCEKMYHGSIHQCAREILDKSGDYKIIMLAGPSSSGKTTTANKLARQASRMGSNAYVISMDDFYLDREKIPFGEDGQRNFETVDSLNIQLLHDMIEELLETGEADLPSFDFVTGKRTDAVMHLKMCKGDIVIIEGLHAINPIFVDKLPLESISRVFACTHSDICYDDSSIIFSRKDVRFLRRMMRDYQFRGSSVEHTYNMWPKVVEGEEKYLMPLMDSADYIIDTLHPYEICAYKDIAIKLLSNLPESHGSYENAKSFVERLEEVTNLSKDIIPRTSLLREFVGT
ncbi:MAG: nucleoside kinase [Ruminococcaceae bacterium]|nr:nucleoside kinase [Oscillospiraceae bacterium]